MPEKKSRVSARHVDEILAVFLFLSHSLSGEHGRLWNGRKLTERMDGSCWESGKGIGTQLRLFERCACLKKKCSKRMSKQMKTKRLRKMQAINDYPGVAESVSVSVAGRIQVISRGNDSRLC